MATQQEVLEGHTVVDLKAFAADHDVDLEGATTKSAIIEALVETTTEQEVADYFDEEVDVATEEDVPTEEEAPAAVAGDPALTDPKSVAEATFEGSTSDPATREEGTTASDVPPDSPQGEKPSDAGAEAYPFPPGGDVEVLLLDDTEYEGEYESPLAVDDWVILDGAHELVPDRLDGHMAVVIKAPSQVAPDVVDGPNAARTPIPDEPITVRTRDEANVTLNLPADAFKAVGKGGRSGVLPVA